MDIRFSRNAFDAYNGWILEDKKIIKKIRELIRDIQKTPFSGIGKPEQLKHNLSGFWSRHISGEHRLIYKIENGAIFIESCKGHYDDK